MTRKLAPRDPDNVAEIEAIIDRIRADWEQEPNVANLGPAIKLVGGRPRLDTLAIRFFVHRKVAAAECEARDWRAIPEEIDGIPTDVTSIQRPPSRLETRRQLFDPLIGGIAIGNARRSSYGTLGGIAFRTADGSRVGLTNEHVLIFTDQGAAGDPVVQPHRGFTDEVSIVDADCCPDGQLSFDRVPNPLAGGLAGGAAAAAVAAAASDVIDPHRRGQEATPVAVGERTLEERVHMTVAYPEMPLPGTSYSLDVAWQYQRITDRGTHHHNVEEAAPNPHVLREQELLTNKWTYAQGEVVFYLAAVGWPGGQRRECPEGHVVAHAVTPSGDAAKRTLLRPLRSQDREQLLRFFNDFELGVVVKVLILGDFDWQSQPVDGVTSFTHQGFTVTALGGGLLRFSDTLPRPIPDGIGEITIPSGGVNIALPVGAERAVAWVFGQHSQPIRLRAFDGDTLVAETSGAGDGELGVLDVSGARITRVVLDGGGGEGLLLLFASWRRLEQSVCWYWGSCRLEVDAEPGMWSTYLTVQTLNDTAHDEDPLVAAQTIGGLLSSANLVSAGRRYQLPDMTFCALDAVADGNFRVVVPDGEPDG